MISSFAPAENIVSLSKTPTEQKIR